MRPTTLIFIAMLTLFGCAKQVSDAGHLVNIRGGNCMLKKNLSIDSLCLDFIDGYDANQGSTDCSALGTTYSLGTSWTSGDANACPTTSTVGTCTIANKGVIYYYNNTGDWNTGNTQADCTTNHGGTWN